MPEAAYMPPSKRQLLPLVRNALAEDIGRGDITTALTVPADVAAHATITARATGVVAGLPLLPLVFECVDPRLQVRLLVDDGATVTDGLEVAHIDGPAAALLSGERVALNFLQRLSGIASLTARYVAAIAGTGARLVDTRKTTPGLRVIEKYAVRVGGGSNHRSGLDDGVLIKENHIAAAGGVTAAVRAARAGAPHPLRVEVEVRNLNELDEALAAQAEVILLDNMSVAELTAAVARTAGRALLEASGGVNLETVRAIAETGVDLISVGALTHSAPALDLSLLITGVAAS